MAAFAMVGAVTVLSWVAFALATVGVALAPGLVMEFLWYLAFANAFTWLLIMAGMGVLAINRRGRG